MKKRLILALLLSASPLWATTYYVDNCVTVGNDRNNGTSASTPWLTINKVNTSKFNPGDSILFESTCTWREQLTVPSSGSAGSPITFGAYGTGAQPIISGADLFTSWTLSSGSVYYTSYSTAPNQVFEDGSRLTQNTVSGASLTAGQWYLDTVNSRIWVYLTAGDSPSAHTIEASQRDYGVYAVTKSYLTISGLETDEAEIYGTGINACTNPLLTGMTALRSLVAGIRIDVSSGGIVSSSTAAYNGGMGFEGYASPNLLFDHLVAHDNSWDVTQNDTSGIKFDDVSTGYWPGTAKTAVNNIVQYSESYSNGVGLPCCAHGFGIWADTIGDGWTVRYNYVHENNGIGIYAEKGSGISVYYNVVANNNGALGDVVGGIVLYMDCDSAGCVMTNSLVANNVAYHNYGHGIRMLAMSVPGGCANNQVSNNISVGNTWDQLDANYGCDNPGTNGSGNVYTYNDFGAAASGSFSWGGNRYSTYPAWEVAMGNCGTAGCSHSVQADPQFVSAATSQFWLAGGSPAIGAGLNLASPYNIGLMPGSTWPKSLVTGDQNAYGSGWEIGAFVYVPVAPLPPTNIVAIAH